MKLDTAKRNSLSKSSFGMPAKRAFPMNDPMHARLAISGATRAFRAGNISKSTEEHIKAKARHKLGIS